ncbi:MAG: hypothetical protein GC193_07610 [Cryomorphaceae bacterium]|nr:hypothetical protein [Cryomorphaceae bacterium]
MRTFFLILLLCQSARMFGAIFINEIVASNNTGIQDDFFQSNDWVEFYNNGGIVNLAGYYLTDNPQNLTKWQIPATNGGLTTILPNSYQIFWLDNDIDQGEDHVGFTLSRDGESLILVMPDGLTIVDHIDFPAQQTDISYGRSCDGCPDWIFFDIPTPDATNGYIQPENALLFINEVMTVNGSYIDDNFGEYDQWFEIFNPNDFQVNLANYTFDLGGGISWQVPNNDPTSTAIPANSFQIFWTDGQVDQGTNHANFSLPIEGGSIILSGPDGANIDTYIYEAATTNNSWGRFQDGGLVSINFGSPTPRFSNQLVFVIPPELYINEIMCQNVGDTLDTSNDYEDWIEIYNPNLIPVDLAGYWLSDNPANPMKWMVPTTHPDSSIIPPGGFLLFFADEQQGQGWNHTSFRLNNQGETITLRSPDGFTIADQIAYPEQFADTSYGRFTDGSPQWVYFLETTPEYSNNGATVETPTFEKDDLLVFPNPATAGMRVNLSLQTNWMLFDARGNIVANGLKSSSFTCPNVAYGMYFLQTDHFSTVKLLIHN